MTTAGAEGLSPRLRTARAVTVAVLALVASLAAPKGAVATSQISTVADPCTGSSDPTLYPNNHRVLVTSTGRWLALFDPAGSGLELAWRDPGGAWNTKSLFEGVTDEVTSDRPASIALDGTGNAWVVWSGYNFKAPLPLRLRRLTDLDGPGGPTLGPVLTVQPVGRGNAYADLAFQSGRGYIVWLQRMGDASYALKTIQFSQLDSATPSFEQETTLYKGSNPYSAGTLVPTYAGMRVVAHAGTLKVFSPTEGTQWQAGSAGIGAYEKARPSAVAFRGGILAAFPTSEEVVKVVRFTNRGAHAWTSLVTRRGRTDGALATDGSNAWLVVVRAGSKASVVSRRFNGSSWGASRTELAANATNGADYQDPNTVRRVTGALRFIVDAKVCPKINIRNAVLAYERAL
jgi:hypothetical protein